MSRSERDRGALRGNILAALYKDAPQTHIPSSAGGLTCLFRSVIFSDYVLATEQGEEGREKETFVEERVENKKKGNRERKDSQGRRHEAHTWRHTCASREETS